MLCEVVVRAATPRDLSARAELVRACITEYDFDAFLMFFFQEVYRANNIVCINSKTTETYQVIYDCFIETHKSVKP